MPQLIIQALFYLFIYCPEESRNENNAHLAFSTCTPQNILQQERTSSVSQQGSGGTGSVACISVGKQESLDYPTSFGMV